ncbi:MAG TPA: hypothetical protein VFH92_07715, partial [Phenylobacterium sp.]|nr:hypothetical protein [Phenylobacterium sp.]
MSRWTLPPLALGEFAPHFVAPTRSNPRFNFNTVAGRHLVLGFAPRDPARRDAGLGALAAVNIEGRFLAAFYVTHEGPEAAPPDRLPAQRW